MIHSTPAYVIHADIGVEAEPPLEGAAAVVMLYAVRVEDLDLAVVPGDVELHMQLALGSQQQLLQALWVVQHLERLSRPDMGACQTNQLYMFMCSMHITTASAQYIRMPFPR